MPYQYTLSTTAVGGEGGGASLQDRCWPRAAGREVLFVSKRRRPPPSLSARLEYLRETFQIREADYLAFDAVGWVFLGGGGVCF